MSTDSIFRQLGRHNESHTGIGPGKTREDYLKLFSRASFSTLNEWPYASPFAGFYDVSNTSTGLILVNQRNKFSHLRGKVVPKEKSRTPENEYKTLYEVIVESEQGEKSKQPHKILLPRMPIDPYRHFDSMFTGQNKYWHNRMCKGSFSTESDDEVLPAEANMTLRSGRPQTARSLSAKRARSTSNQRRAKSALGSRDKFIDEFKADPAFAKSIYNYYHYVLEKSQPPKIGLQQYPIKEPNSRFLRQSGIYRSPALTYGQQLYLLDKCRIYDMENSKVRHTKSYLQVLANRFNADLPSYKLGLNDPREYFSYQKFIKTPRSTARPINTGFMTSKSHHSCHSSVDKKQHQPNVRTFNHLDKRDFTRRSTSSFNDRKPSKDNSSTSSRRISASSFSTHNSNAVNVRFRRDSNEVPKIPVVLPKAQN